MTDPDQQRQPRPNNAGLPPLPPRPSVPAPDQLPQYQPSESSRSSPSDAKDPYYAPFLPASVSGTSISGDTESTLLASTSRSPLSINTSPSARAEEDRSPLSAVTDEQIATWKRDNAAAPYVEAEAAIEEDGMIGMTLDVRGATSGPSASTDKALPPIPINSYEEAIEAMVHETDRKGKGPSAYGPRGDFPPPLMASASSSSRRDSDSVNSAAVKGKGCRTEDHFWYDETIPPMNIVIFIVGSRGDVQPYVALALALITLRGHRVRIATHPDFESFVTSANSRLRGLDHNGVALEGKLEFFNAGGDPKSLMEYMVNNPGLMPGFQSLTNGDIGRKKKMTGEMLRGFYRSTFCPSASGQEFAADAIISNPPAFAHFHIAEALGIPLHMSFTMPWTATSSFPHPLINVKRSNADKSLTNYMGYGLANMLMWEGLGNTINKFRTRDLRLDVLPDRVASDVIDNLKIPWTYCWSPGLLPKPADWRGHIDVSGFYFLDGDNSYTPPPELANFLKGGAPVYIGFGSIVIPDAEKVTDMLFGAIAKAGVRAIVSAGWAGLGKGKEATSPDILVWSRDVPHEWLFAEDRVSGVMHHGGAGTTACGLRHGRPTIIVPFFGDQKFWGDSVHQAGAGPAPIPFKTINEENLAAALISIQTEDVRSAAAALGERIRAEKGELRGAESFHRQLPLDDMRCDMDPTKVATLYSERLSLRLSAEAAGVLLENGKILSNDLVPHRHVEYDTSRHAKDPLAGTGSAINNVLKTSVTGVGQLFYSPINGTVKTFYGIPEASLAVVGDLYEGFENLPAMMGSTERPRGRVTGFVSGLEEGGKALGWGLWDGITGLVTEPADGARRDGMAGFGKGLGRGFANLMVRPAAGTLGLFVHPMRGARLSVRNALGSGIDPLNVLLGPRIQLAVDAARRMRPEDKARLLGVYERLDAETTKRRRERDGTRWFLFATRRERMREREARERDKEEKRVRKEMKALKLKEAQGGVEVAGEGPDDGAGDRAGYTQEQLGAEWADGRVLQSRGSGSSGASNLSPGVSAAGSRRGSANMAK